MHFAEPSPSRAFYRMKETLNGLSEKMASERGFRVDLGIYLKIRKALDIRSPEELKAVLLDYAACPKVRKAIESIEAMYKGRLRKTGDPEMSHFLQVAVFSAATGGSRDEIVLALLHDAIEDMKDGSGLKFAYFEGRKRRELGTAEEAMAYVRTEYGDWVADRLEIMTRKKELGQTYEDYLELVVQDGTTDKLKKIDKICNLWDMDRIINIEEKRRMVPRTLQKTWSQVLVAKEDWIYEVLQYAWQEVVDWAMMQEELTAPRTPALESAISKGLSKPQGLASPRLDAPASHQSKHTHGEATASRPLAEGPAS
ncbi:Uncharacterised protein [uncultured archaeon]|nr:Uncharacterised protein [uncultured archaeon]